MSTNESAVSTAAEQLRATTVPVDRLARTDVPAASGVYAWWAKPSVFEDFGDHTFAHGSNVRLLYLGLASNLRRRIVGNHLKRSGSSTLRRTFAGLLMDTENFRTRRTDRVILESAEEIRLTAWMEEHLHLSWIEHPAPGEVEGALIKHLRPPLNISHTFGPAREVIAAARARYYASAPAKETRISGDSPE